MRMGQRRRAGKVDERVAKIVKLNQTITDRSRFHMTWPSDGHGDSVYLPT